MSTPAYVTSFSPGSGKRRTPRAHVQSTAEVLRLDPEWAFHFSTNAAGAGDEASQPGYDDSQWDTIRVPSHWVLTGGGHFGAFGRYGAPAYQNVAFPFPVHVPHVPDENPTGDYRTHFHLTSEQLADAHAIVLRTLGIESLAVISVNGNEVGVVSGSRLTQELDITDSVHEGTNTLHIRVHQWSAHTYLEDQDQWWLPGIFRDVEILVRPAHGIDDVWLRADYSPLDSRGTLIPEIRAHASAYPITLSIAELGVHEVWSSPEQVTALEVGEVDPWSPDSPRLYTATVSNAAEELTLRLGFRRVEIVGQQWRVNGMKLRIRGVNRHEFDPDHGRVWDKQKAREGLLAMKQHNINAIRTSHYPPHPEFFDLTDELGFWVMDECDYEAHGFELIEWRDVPADDPRWREVLLDRVERFFERDKNHASIISWSLGNEGHTGANMAAMAEWLRARDPERPVHYEPDFDGAYTDVVSRMYPPVELMKQMSRGEGQGFSQIAGRHATLAERPMIVCEYAHAMGNGPGGLAEYEEVFRTYPQWHGGFIWEWRDHGIRTRIAGTAHEKDAATEFFAYGGDFGEQVHDGPFVCDGLVLSSGIPSPALAQVKAVFSPISLQLLSAQGEHLRAGDPVAPGQPYTLVVVDERTSGSSEDVRVVVVDEADGIEYARHIVPLTDIRQDEGRRQARLALPPCELPLDEDHASRPDTVYARRIFVELTKPPAWAPQGHVFAQIQVRCAQPRPVTSSFTRVIEPAASLAGCGAVFDPATGDLVSLARRSGASRSHAREPLALNGPRLELYRAPTANDSLTTFGSYLYADPSQTCGEGKPGPSTNEHWLRAGLDRLQRRVVSVHVDDSQVRAVHRYSPANIRAYVDLEMRWRVDAEGGGLLLDAHAYPSTGWDVPWARLGLSFTAPLGATNVHWFGQGPHEAYPDSRAASLLGHYSMPARELVTQYAVPQESGYRPQLHHLRVDGLDLDVRTMPVGATQERPGFIVREHSIREVAAAAHPHELPQPSATHLVFDLQQHGLGSRSCGPDTLPAYQLWARSGTWRMVFAAQ